MEKRIKDYIYIKDGNQWVQEHRKTVENFIRRKLKRVEVIHHLDLNKHNNSINNLMIFPSQSEHLKFHIDFDKYGWNKRNRRMIKERWIKYMAIV